MSDDFKALIAKVATGASLTREESASAFDRMMSGEATPSQMGGLLMALRVRGETVDEITGAVAAMRAKMLRVDAPAGAVDVVGTGGDGSGSVNVSTCASFIVAGCGVPVATHGNRALSSRSGASSGHEECRPDPCRARYPHDFQSAWTAVQSRRRHPADGRRVLAAMGA